MLAMMLSLLTAPVRLASTLLQALLKTPGRSATAQPEATEPPPPTSAATATPERPPGRVGKHDRALLELVAAQPGITVAQAAAQLGIHPTALYPVIRRLEPRRELIKRGRELYPR